MWRRNFNDIFKAKWLHAPDGNARCVLGSWLILHAPHRQVRPAGLLSRPHAAVVSCTRARVAIGTHAEFSQGGGSDHRHGSAE